MNIPFSSEPGVVNLSSAISITQSRRRTILTFLPLGISVSEYSSAYVSIMAEAVAAFAVAGNVLQFLTCGARFLTNATKIYRARGDGVAIVKDLRNITADFQATLKGLGDLQASARKQNLSPALPSLSRECSEVIRGVLSRLEKIGIYEKGRRIDMVLSAFRGAWYEKEIQDLTNRMNSLRARLAAAMVSELR